MSRSGYSDDCDVWAFVRWRGAVKSAERGKRGQAFLRELKAAIESLPEEKLCADFIANPESGEVCALGALLLKRKTDAGVPFGDALKAISEEFPEYTDAEEMTSELGIARALAQEIVYLNDDYCDHYNPEGRYLRMVRFINDMIIPQEVAVQ